MAIAFPTITAVTKRSELVANLGVPTDWLPITPDDAKVYSPPLRAIRCDTGGTLAVVTPASASGGSPTTRLMKFANGETREGQFLMVTATGTSGPANIEGAV